MMQLGKKQTLYINRIVGTGAYLCEEQGGESTGGGSVLLPKRQVPAKAKKGDALEVFLYRDSEDRLIATTREPKLTLGETAVLEVADAAKVGAFLDWGLEKDLLLPFGEQLVPVKKGERYLVGLYIDKSSRLCATMKVYDFLRTESPYKAGDVVKGIVYDVNPNYGVFVAVDDCYNAMIPKNEMVRNFKTGERLRARVIGVREDGKLNLSLREKSYIQMDVDSAKIMDKLSENGGFLPYHDKSSPDAIRREFGMSKNEFKRAIGRLYKGRSIEITDKGIRRL